MSFSELLAPIHQFLHCQTPDAWLDKAAQPEMLPVLLTDHLLCELKTSMCALDQQKDLVFCSLLP